MLACPVDHVVLLPNASQVTGVAEAAADRGPRAGRRGGRGADPSPVQGLAAVAVHDASRRFDDDVVAMAEAAAATRWAEVTVAEREALTSVGRCQPGDVLGLIDGEVVEIGRRWSSVAVAIIDRLLGVGRRADHDPGRGARPNRMPASNCAGTSRRWPRTSRSPCSTAVNRTIPLLIGVE